MKISNNIKFILTFLILNFFTDIANAQISNLTYEQYVKLLKKVPVADGQMSYLDKGKGEEVFVMLHGVPTSSWLYRKINASLILNDKRVIAPDLLGYGCSDKPSSDDASKATIYHPEKQAQRVFDLLDTLDIKSFTLVCHDMGSLVAWKMLDLDSNHKIKNLVVLNSILEKEGFKPPLKFKKGFIGKNFAKIYCSGLGKSMIKTTLNNGLHDSKISKKALHGYVKPLKRGGHHALYTFFTNFDEMYRIIEDNPQRFKNFDGEILFIWGKHDDILTIEQCKHASKWNDSSVEHVLTNSSHFVQEEEPENIVNILINL